MVAPVIQMPFSEAETAYKRRPYFPERRYGRLVVFVWNGVSKGYFTTNFCGLPCSGLTM